MATGRLTTHVLDTARGCPAAGLRVTLDRIPEDGRGGREHIAEVSTNADGRTDAPMLEGTALTPGLYELTFDVGAYLDASGAEGARFLDRVPVRFRIEDAGQHYHVPLLVAPFGYSTYRGS